MDRAIKKAIIKRASNRSLDDIRTLYQLEETAFKTLFDRLINTIMGHVIDHGSVNRINRLRQLYQKTVQEFYKKDVDLLLQQYLEQAAGLANRVFIDFVAARESSAISRQSIKTVRSFRSRDGLVLSDRLWGQQQKTRELVGQVIEGAIFRGDGASKAAREFVRQGATVPAINNQLIRQAEPEQISKTLRDSLLKNGPYRNAIRIAKTETGRAYASAYQANVDNDPDLVGTRFVLSPNHPRVDICDLHARANLYGLGPGVYPPGKNPYPAHPETLSYVEAVFKEDVSSSDRRQQQSVKDWLMQQNRQTKIDVLGGRNKAIAFERGLIGVQSINTPWSVIEKRLTRLGRWPI